MFSNDEVVGPNGRRVRDVKWVSKAGSVHDVFCPVNVFAVESEGDKISHYYRERKSFRAFEKLVPRAAVTLCLSLRSFPRNTQ